MEIYSTSISASSMMVDDDGMYYGTILASRHGMGTNAFVVRAVHKNNNTELENVLCAYKTEANGDIKIYADEPVSIRVTIGQGVPLTSLSIAGEGEDYEDA